MEHQSFAINTARSTRTWKIGGFPGGGVFLDRVAFAELSVFVAAAVHDVPKVATVEVPNATDTMEKSQSNIDKINSFRGKQKKRKKRKKGKKEKKITCPRCTRPRKCRCLGRSRYHGCSNCTGTFWSRTVDRTTHWGTCRFDWCIDHLNSSKVEKKVRSYSSLCSTIQSK
jgi:hypothetical protein